MVLYMVGGELIRVLFEQEHFKCEERRSQKWGFTLEIPALWFLEEKSRFFFWNSAF